MIKTNSLINLYTHVSLLWNCYLKYCTNKSFKRLDAVVLSFECCTIMINNDTHLPKEYCK